MLILWVGFLAELIPPAYSLYDVVAAMEHPGQLACVVLHTVHAVVSAPPLSVVEGASVCFIGLLVMERQWLGVGPLTFTVSAPAASAVSTAASSAAPATTASAPLGFVLVGVFPFSLRVG